MTSFVAGFITAVIIFAALVSIAHSIERGGAEDYFKVYYTRDSSRDDIFEYKLEVPKYGRIIGGPMAKDIYRWLTKGPKGDNEDE